MRIALAALAISAFAFASPANAGTVTWTGASGFLWSDALNWTGGVPIAGDTLVFPSGAANLANTNNLPAGTPFGALVFNGPGYTISGNAIGLSGGVAGFGTVNLDITLLAPQTFQGGTFAGAIDLQGYLLTTRGNGPGSLLQATGIISGTGGIQAEADSHLVLSGSNTYTGVTTAAQGSTLEINGAQPASNLQATSSQVLGTGTIGTATLGDFSNFYPGYIYFTNSLGIFTTGDLTLSGNGSYNASINGGTAGTGYSQLKVNGTVDLGSNKALWVILNPSFLPAVGQTFTLIDNDGADPITGIFQGLPSGSTITLNNAYPFQISYAGGSGNDVVLTSLSGWEILLTPSSSTVIGGVPFTATVTLAGPAPAGGAAVSLTSSDTTAATVPASVTVAAGTTSRNFTVTTKAVAAQASVTISASYGGSTAGAGVIVNPAELVSFTVSPASVIGGNTSKGTVTLNGKAPGAGAIVTLSSGDASATLPPTVKVSSGGTSATFTIKTTPVATTAGPFDISANYHTVTLTAPLTVREATASKLTVSPSSVIGGVTPKGTITLTGDAPAGGAFVALGSDNSAATVPANITVSAGSSSTTFTINTISVAATQGPFDISATYNAVTVKDQLTVQALALSKIVVTPSSVTGGTSASGTVTLTANAPAGGVVVALASANAAATAPANVTVTAGTSTATFPIATTPVAVSTGNFNISAAYNGVTKSDQLAVKAPAALSLVLNPATVQGGNPSVAIVTLNGPAPSGGMVVTLKSANTAVATVPATVTVAANNTTATFDVTTVAVASSKTAKISATAGGSTKTATLTVTP